MSLNCLLRQNPFEAYFPVDMFRPKHPPNDVCREKKLVSLAAATSHLSHGL